jgi:hypothetical protein
MRLQKNNPAFKELNKIADKMDKYEKQKKKKSMITCIGYRGED